MTQGGGGGLEIIRKSIATLANNSFWIIVGNVSLVNTPPQERSPGWPGCSKRGGSFVHIIDSKCNQMLKYVWWGQDSEYMLNERQNICRSLEKTRKESMAHIQPCRSSNRIDFLFVKEGAMISANSPLLLQTPTPPPLKVCWVIGTKCVGVQWVAVGGGSGKVLFCEACGWLDIHQSNWTVPYDKGGMIWANYGSCEEPGLGLCTSFAT